MNIYIRCNYIYQTHHLPISFEYRSFDISYSLNYTLLHKYMGKIYIRDFDVFGQKNSFLQMYVLHYKTTL
jgi:hypothetical protein